MGEEQPKRFAQISRESVKTYAESVGIGDLSEDAAAMLAEDVCYRLRQAAQASTQYMKHSKRRKMTSEDFNRALKWMDVEPIYGYGSQDPMLFRTTKDAELYFMEDKEINLPEISMDGKIPVCAGKTTVRVHASCFTGKRNGQVQAQTLSEDLVKYHENVTKAILGNDEDIMKVALDDLRTNSKVSSLLPYLIQFVSVGVKKVNHDLGQLTKLMHIVMSLIYNPFVYLGPYLKRLVSSVMYCIMEPLAASINPLNDHWTLRDYAARLLAHICKTYNSSVNHLKNQLYAAFQEVLLDHARPLCSHYGAIVGLMALGPKAIEDVLLPQLSGYWPTLMVVLEDTSLSNIQVKTDGHKVYGAILLAANKMLKYKQKEQLSTKQHSASSSPSQSPAQEPTEFTFGTASHLLHLGESAGSLSQSDGYKLRHVKKSVLEWYTELYEYFGDCLSLQLDTITTCNPVYEPKLTSLADINNVTACNEHESRFKGGFHRESVDNVKKKFIKTEEYRGWQFKQYFDFNETIWKNDEQDLHDS
uniref:TAF6-like RNA polymerase II p300/CBP-associated factor-associated factor 65 kDa subunit 6L-like n=1 Tax=Saccoglossus kowalevskii TaxID=10224 RepID=A0ABM0MD77_SACKO|nr:PREDICTED: TAF6-like RNA polymerase II p300/CBP-associated factor-associated factor 65 kDa subunit 6L-like [Saccoglossus kowalevskii]